MGIGRKKAMVTGECVACGCCEGKCPLNAVEVYKGVIAKVDTGRCVGCGRCADHCPAQVIFICGQEAVS